MIRINLLKPQAGSPGFPLRPENHWIRRRELWLAIALLAAGMTLLFYMASHTPRPRQQPHSAQTPAPIAPPVQQPPPTESEPRLPQSREGADPNPPSQPAPLSTSTARATDLSIDRQPENLTVALRLTGPIQYESKKMDTPNRLVIDVSNCELALPREQLRQTVEHPEVKRVRAAQFQIDPPICRVVLDVTSFPRYQIQPGPERLEIRIPGAGQ